MKSETQNPAKHARYGDPHDDMDNQDMDHRKGNHERSQRHHDNRRMNMKWQIHICSPGREKVLRVYLLMCFSYIIVQETFASSAAAAEAARG